ncbi:MAG: sulfatase [Candidatus Liptonbacteria bacterium]|nr:sulfatase [Candidatus Liptonbacteria bacterium]
MPSQKRRTKPNVIFIVIDGLRADHLGSFGYRRPTSRFLDAFAKNSVNFRSHFSNSSQSAPGFFSIFASAYPFMRSDWTTTKGPYEFLSEVFRKNGYKTAGFACSPYISSFFGYDRGFDDFYYSGCHDDSDAVKKTIKSTLPSRMFEMLKKFVKTTTIGKMMNRIRFRFLMQPAYSNSEAINEIVENHLSRSDCNDRPLFAWIHYLDAHVPFRSKKNDIRAVGGRFGARRANFLDRKVFSFTLLNPFVDEERMTVQELKDLELCYDAQIYRADRNLEKLFSMLSENGISRENSVIAITADHGEGFGEHFGIGHTMRLYDELVHVPFFLSVPGGKPREVYDLTNHIDIVPTLAASAGISLRSRFIKGKNVLKGSDTKYVFSEVAPNLGGMLSKIDFSRSVFSVRGKEWKYIKDYAREREELYHLSEDPDELKDLSQTEVDVKNKLWNLLRVHIKRKTKAVPYLKDV